VGAGLRYKSPIGPVRLDLARRLDDEPMFSLEPRYGVHFSVSEAF
jgi:outer membrane translocation and assembly module TamA